MQTTHIIRAPQPIERNKVRRRIRDLLARKLWLPRVLYEALPYLYLLLSIAALASAMHLRGWAWIVPYMIMLGLICLHVSAAIITLRYRHRHPKGPTPAQRAPENHSALQH